MKSLPLLFVLCCLLTACQQKAVLTGAQGLIPLPNQLTRQAGFFSLERDTRVYLQTAAHTAAWEPFATELQTAFGFRLPVVDDPAQATIILQDAPGLPAEAYRMQVLPAGIQIKASSDAGLFYAIQSLRQLMPAAFFSESETPGIGTIEIPAVEIDDAPAFAWRGFMLDVSRHFFTVEQVKMVLDQMAELKLNRFHWHLTDDQGWRLAINAFPRLTEVGAWRVDYNTTDETISNWWGRPTQQPGDTASYGGYYTQQQVREIIAYAKKRHIEIIPEIDMPGHAQATIAAYPEIGCVNAAAHVATGGVFQNNTYNPGKEATYAFVETMLNEVMDLFPFEYVHIGGDECNKSQWRVDSFAQAKMQAEGLKTEEELQAYFIKRVEQIINARGKTMIGWDEILEGGLAPNAVLMSWRGEAGGKIAARAGHEVIMTPSNYCYIDLKQGHDDLEPNLGYSQLLLSTAYNYDVLPADLTPGEAARIKGIQANLWTESISDWSKLTYMSYPRLFAIAENSWTQPEYKDWNDFTDRLQVQMQGLDQRGLRYAVSAFSPWIDHQGDGQSIEISMHTEVNGLDMYYTLDGSEPGLTAKKYSGPFRLSESAQLRARAFKGKSPIGYLSALDFPVHRAAGIPVRLATGDTLSKLTDLSYGKLQVGDPHWQTFEGPAELRLDLGAPQSLRSLSFHALRFTISGYYPPASIEVLGSLDGVDYQRMGYTDLSHTAATLSPAPALIQGRNKVPVSVALDSKQIVRYLKIIAPNHPVLGPGQHRAGQASKLKMDELVLY